MPGDGRDVIPRPLTTGRRSRRCWAAAASTTLALTALIGSSGCGPSKASSQPERATTVDSTAAPPWSRRDGVRTTTTSRAPTPSRPTTTAPAGPLAVVPDAERPVPLGDVGAAAPTPSPPVEIELPSIGVRSGLERLGLDATGILQPPRGYASAGWLADGPEPGQTGPAIIAGHVDSRSGPAVFYRLHELRPGDAALVHRADGSTLRFRVLRTGQYPKSNFPTREVYGPSPVPELRIITCGGLFNHSSGHYVDNVVVYATPA